MLQTTFTMRPIQMLRAFAFNILLFAFLASALAPTDEIMDCDTAQSGYLDNHKLSPDIVNDPGFGILWQISTNGGSDELFFAKPLVYTPASTGRQVVIAASAKNWVYIIDANNGTILASRQLAKPFKQADIGCTDVQPYIGIMGTPVIDPGSDTIYLFSKSYADTSASGAEGVANGRYRVYALSALDLTNRPGYPIVVDGTQADNDPAKYFMGGTHMQRPSLAMISGVVWAGFASHCDQYNYTGWVMGIDPSAARVVSLFSTISGAYSIPQSTTGSFAGGSGGGGAGIWQAGMGLATDRSDRFFAVTGNGYAHQNQAQSRSGKNPPGTFEECIISFKIDPQTKKATPQDFFQPYEYLNLDMTDKDFGSSGLTLLDPGTFTATGISRMGVTGGKNGKIYLVNADDLGGYKMSTGGGDAVLQTITPPGGSIFGGIGSYPKEGGYIYAASPNWNIVVYSFGKDSAGKPVFTQVGMTAEKNAQRVGTGIPTITSMGGAPGSAILWLTDVDNGLRAWKAVPNADGSMTKLTLPPLTYVGKWQRPGFGDGKVYVPGANGKITCLGAPINLPLTCTSLDFGSVNIGSTKTLNVQCQANIAISSFKGLIISPGIYFHASNSSVSGISLAKGSNVTIPVTLDLTSSSGQTFTPGTVTSSLQVMTNNGVAGYTSQQPVTLSVNIVSSAAFLQVQPLEVSFGGVVFGSQQQTDGVSSSIYIKNIGTQPLTIVDYIYSTSGVDNIDNSSQWTTIRPPTGGGLWYINDGFEAEFPAKGSTIAGGSSVAVTLNFQPTHTGDFSTWVAVKTSAGYAIFVMSGTSSTAPLGTLQMLTSEGGVINNKFYDFGSVMGGTVQTATIIISNTGGSPLQITKSKPPGQPELYATHPGDQFTENQMIAPGKNATGSVAFAPFVRSLVNQDPQTYTDYWVLNTNGDNFGGPYDVKFTGTVVTKQVGPLYSNGTGRYKYLGCYIDSTNGVRIAPNKYTFQGTNENGLCQTTCASKGYAFALTEYAYECWCGNSVPDASFKKADDLCVTQCPGDKSQSCGGDGGYGSAWYDSSRYDPSTNLLDGVLARPPSFMQTAGGFTFVGCWSDSTGNRSLKDKTTANNNINITSCASTCAGYTYMATSYGNECYCGNTLGGVSRPNSECSMVCAADMYSFCGAASRLSLYVKNGTSLPSTSTSAMSSTTSTSRTSSAVTTATTTRTSTTSATSTASGLANWDYTGCWTDNVADRSLQDLSYNAADNSLQKCATFCAGYKYFGVEYSSECYCGNNLGGSSALEADCYKTCSGSNETCGGDNRLNVYSAQASVTTSDVPSSPSSWDDMGCYKDFTGDRALLGKVTTSTNNSAASCFAFCNSYGFLYFGTEYANECYCGNAIVGAGVPTTSGCTYKCSGDQNQFCGGSNRINMYIVRNSSTITTTSTTSRTSSTTLTTTTTTSTTSSTASSTAPSTTSTAISTTVSVSSAAGPTFVASYGNFQFLSCWADSTLSRALAGWGLDPSSDMTVEKCLDYCSNKQYVGVEDGRECWCGDIFPNGQAAVNTECNEPCSGASNENCGGPQRLAIYHKVSNNPAATSTTTGTTTSAVTTAAGGPTIVASYKGFVYQSCWTDLTANRTLGGWGLDPSNDMTVEKCIDACASTKQYAGLEDSRECWCGSEVLTGESASDSECKAPCGGAPGSACGGPSRLVLYKKDPTWSSTSTSTTSTGVNNLLTPTTTSTTSRTSSTSSTSISTSTTTSGSSTTTTTTSSSSRTTTLSSSTSSSSSRPTSSTTPSTTFTTATTTTTSRSSSTNSTTTSTTFSSSRTTTTTTTTTPSSATTTTTTTKSPTTTTTTTTTTTIRTTTTITTGTTTITTMSTTTVGSPPNGSPQLWQPKGCFIDSVNSRTLPNKTRTLKDTMTVENCQDYCMSTFNLPLAGLESGKECYCGDRIPSGLQGDQTGCTMACSGDNTETCGGSRRLDVYQNRDWSATIIQQSVLGWNYIGCWTETSPTRAISAFRPPSSTSMTTAMCITTCREKGYTFAGLQNGSECYCGSSKSAASQSAPDEQCNFNCPGNVTEFCGAPNRLQVYTIPDGNKVRLL